MSERHTFEAKYYGTCWSCQEPIEPGDSICYNDGDDIVHEGCE